jgi:hypothetical protein
MGALNPPADRGGPPSSERLNSLTVAEAPLPALPRKGRVAVQLQAQTRHEHPAPQVEMAEAVAAWLVG